MNIINQETGEVIDLHGELMSREISELAKALAKAQGAMTSAQKDGTNPHFGKSYATLDSIWQAIRKPLSEHGLCVVQSFLPDNTLVTTLLHESGQWVRSYQKLNPVRNDPQGVGSALTYGRRYSLAAIVGICQADDDGEAASTTEGKAGKQDKQSPAKAEKIATPGNVWLPTKEEFFDKVFAELKTSQTDARAILKEAGYTAYSPDKAADMYKTIEKEVRIRKEAEKVRAHAEKTNGAPVAA